jgi:hypothetical protein
LPPPASAPPADPSIAPPPPAPTAYYPSPAAPPPAAPPASAGHERVPGTIAVRMSIGAAFHKSTPTLAPGVSREVSMAGVMLDVGVGATIAPGLVLMGDFAFHLVQPDGSKTSNDGSTTTPKSQVSYGRLGALLDWFVDPKDGFHLQAGVGRAVYHYSFDVGSVPGATGTSKVEGNMSGIGVHAGVGYEMWVAKHWAFGGLVAVESGWVSNGPESAHVVAPSIVFTASYYLLLCS